MPLFLANIKPLDDAEKYLKMFEGTTLVCSWLRGEWGLHIYALLMGEAQMVARRLPPECQLHYMAVLERVGLSPVEHR